MLYVYNIFCSYYKDHRHRCYFYPYWIFIVILILMRQDVEDPSGPLIRWRGSGWGGRWVRQVFQTFLCVQEGGVGECAASCCLITSPWRSWYKEKYSEGVTWVVLTTLRCCLLCYARGEKFFLGPVGCSCLSQCIHRPRWISRPSK